MGRAWLAGATMLALLSACSSGGAEPAPPGPNQNAAPAKQSALNAAADADAKLQDARNRLYDKCMTGKGFTLHPQHEPTDPTRDTVKEPPIARPENAEDARRYGYRISEGPQTAPTEKTVNHDPFTDQPQDVQKRYNEGLTGPGNPTRSERVLPGDKEREIYVMPDGSKKFVYKQGCQPEVDRAVLGDVKRYIELRYAGATGLDKAVYQAAYNDPEVATARTAWAGCLSSKGYPGMQDPVEAARKAELFYQNVDQRNPDALRQARDKEIAQAVAHAECDAQTQVETKLQAAWRKEYANYLTAHEADLVAWQEFARGALARAQQLLAG